MSGLLLHSVTVDGMLTSVRMCGDQITEIGPDVTARAGDSLLDGAGGAVIPGLHDHHIHLAAMAAADRSLTVDGSDLDAVLRADHECRPAGEWVRAVGYDDDAAGPLDRFRLDAAAPGRGVRVQHRSGAVWILSSAALARLDIPDDLPGVERDHRGLPTGRMFRLDDWLRDRVPIEAPPDLASVTRRLAQSGVTGVTDATPTTRLADLELLAAADLEVRVTAMGGPPLTDARFPEPLGRGPVKVIVSDDRLPDLEDLIQIFETSHAAGRAVAVHCVTRVALALALAAWDTVGSMSGDRVEHGAVISPDLRDRLAGFNLTVVTQPGFVSARGDRYLAEVAPDDVPHLYPCASLLRAGIGVGGSTDAPFGPADPWAAIAAAIDRRTASGADLGRAERVEPRRALDLFLSTPSLPGGPPRRVQPGTAADLCLLDGSVEEVLEDPSAAHVRATVCAGRLTFAGRDLTWRWTLGFNRTRTWPPAPHAARVARAFPSR
jgi:predicted amidohydrolase YtcJ